MRFYGFTLICLKTALKINSMSKYYSLFTGKRMCFSMMFYLVSGDQNFIQEAEPLEDEDGSLGLSDVSQSLFIQQQTVGQLHTDYRHERNHRDSEINKTHSNK